MNHEVCEPGTQEKLRLLEANAANSRRFIEGIAEAVEFLDKCRMDDSSSWTGALKDAHNWLESSAREAVAAMKAKP